MRILLSRVLTELRPLDYKRAGSRFFKIEGGFYKLIDFQRGAHGSYFFVNVCVHPVGLPQLLPGKLVLLDRPREYECILRQRLERIVQDSSTAAFRSGLVFVCDNDAINRVLPALSTGAQSWLSQWSSFSRILAASEGELQRMLTVVPKLWHKACSILKCYCALREYRLEESQRYLKEFLDSPNTGCDFSRLDDYMRSLTDEISRNPRRYQEPFNEPG